MTVQEFSVEGMTCTGCSRRIEKALSSTPGIKRAVVNFATHSAIVESDLAGDAVAQVVRQLGYKATLAAEQLDRETMEKQEQLSARNRLVLALVLAVPVITLGMIHSLGELMWVRLTGALLTGWLLIFPGRGFFTKAVLLLKHKSANMDTLVALGAGLSYVWSVYQTWRGGEHVYFETAAAIVAFVLIGKYVEHRMTWRATAALGALLRLQPRTAQRFIGENPSALEEVDLRFIRRGDKIQTRLGERFAVDGVVISGTTEADEALLTGEGMPVAKREGDRVVAGSLNLLAPVVVVAESIGRESRLGEIVAFVERTRLNKAPAQRLADQVSGYFVPVILLLSLATFLFWSLVLSADVFFALNAAVSVLVVACPCALGLATPIALAIATSRAARMGLLFRDLSALEALQSVQMVVLDKTGTLTEGRLQVVEEFSFANSNEPQWLKPVLFSLEKISQHPVALALVAWLEKNIDPAFVLPPLLNRRETAGEGVHADLQIDGQQHSLQVGRARPNELALFPEKPSATWIVCRFDNVPLRAFALEDTLRAEAKNVLSALHASGIEPVLLSGDRTAVVNHLGSALGLQAHAEQTPQMKAEFISRAQAQGKKVAMLGDGVNDAPALARADVGIAMGSGTDAAQQTAAVTLKNPSLVGVLTAFQLSRSTFRNIKQNLVWAFGYNVVLLPLAMSGKLSPMWAAAAMVFSSLFVVANSLRLLRFESRVQS